MTEEKDIYAPEESHLWAVHSSSDERPLFRGWARSESEASTLLGQLKTTDPEPEQRYWHEPITVHDLAVYRAAGLVPEDA
jgi:hypothetical protein